MEQSNRYVREVVRMPLLAGDEGVVRDMAFEGCDIKGPAVLVPQGSTIEHSTFRGDADALFWEIPRERSRVIGAVLVERCIFTGCTFENVGFAGPPEFIAALKGDV